MHRICLLLLGMASLVASGVIMDRGRVGLNTMGSLGLQTVQGIRGGVGAGNVLSRDELVRQKFILDILYQVYHPLQQQDLLVLDDVNIITNENLYMRPLTQEMVMVLDLIASNQLLSKQTICNMNNEQHIRQTVGFYRLLVAAGDFDTFKRLVVHARQNLNTEIFVNCLVLALGERQDTQMLIVPALYEILPQLFLNDNVIDQIRNVDTTISSVKPQLIDVMGMGHRNMLLNSQISDQQQGGLFGVLNRSQLWMPWRQLHKQIALRKMMGGNVVQQDETQIDKMVVSIPSSGLLSEDIGLKAYVNILIHELIVNQDTVRNLNKNSGMGGQAYGHNDYVVGRRGQIGLDDIVSGTNSQYGTTFGGRHIDTMQGGINTDRVVHVGRRFRESDLSANDDLNINGGTTYGMGIGIDISGGTKYGQVQRHGNIDENDLLTAGRHLKNRFDIDDEINTNNNMYMGYHNVQEGQRGINTVSANDARLLFVGRRRKNPNSVVTMGNIRYDNDDDLVSGGRHVFNDRTNDERQRSKYNNDNDDVTVDDIRRMNNEQYINVNRRGMPVNINNDEDDVLLNKYRGIGSNVNYRDSWQNQQVNDNVNRNYRGQNSGLGMGSGRGRDDFLNIVTHGQSFDNDQGLMWNRGAAGQYNGDSLDTQLPTTSINDERLLHINRRKLNNIEQGRRFNNIGGVVVNDANDPYDTGYKSHLQGNNRDIYGLGNQNGQLGGRNSDSGNNRGEHHGRRYRRSIVSQGLGQTNSLNGKLVLHTLQQLVARLNVERIALGQPQLIDDAQNNIVRGILNNLAGGSDIRGVAVQTVNKIENIIQQIDNVLQQKIGQITVSSYNQKVNEIGLMLAGQIQDIGLVDILGEVLQQTNQQQREGVIANAIENEAVQVLLAGIVKVVDNKVQQVFRQHKEFISTVQGVNINDVEVDKLQTYLESTEVDLTNLLNNNINNMDQTTQSTHKVVVGRVPRLNHKSFKIEIDVTSDRQQQVVVRNLLVPKVDGHNNIIPLVERRQNVIVLDITTVQLKQGSNTIKLNSKDNTLTSRDTTPVTKIYQLVMQALNGDIMLQQDVLAGQTTLLPHNLLLPRGRTTGLPMKLITVITPLQGASGIIDAQKSAGLNTLLLDRLPLNYPLHCDITDLDDVISMPNLMVKDVNIYHDDNIKMSPMNMY